MVSITPSAAERIRRLGKGERDLVVLRLGVIEGGCSGSGYQYEMTPNAEREDDDVVFPATGVIIVVDPASHRYLNGTELDYEDSLMQSGFVFHNPNAISTCACGKSFHVQGEDESFAH